MDDKHEPDKIKDSIVPSFRDSIAIQLMSGKVNEFYDAAKRKNIGTKDDERWIHLSAQEATQERIDKASRMAYRIADSLIKARSK